MFPLGSLDMGEGLGDALQKFMSGASISRYGLAGLQGLTTAAGLMSQMAATRAEGQAAKRSAYMTAQDELLNSTQAYVSAQGEVTGLRRNLADVLGSRAVAARGVDGGQGVVQDNARDIYGRGLASEGIIRANAEIVAGRHRLNALNAYMKGDAAEREANSLARAQLGSGLLSGLVSIGKMFL
jgi:hypothetical protein